MKPTSMIFLVLSLILMFGGFMTCSIANSMASSQNISIYNTHFDENGDLIYNYALSNTAIHKLALNFSDVDIRIVGNAATSYVELKNFDVNSYRVNFSGGQVTVDGTTGFFSSLLDMSSGGLQFKGLRYFLLDKPDPSRERSVTVYLSSLSDLTSLSVSLQKGSVSFQDIDNALDYNVSLNEADVSFENVVTTSVAAISGKANISIISSRFATLNATITGGNMTIRGNDVLTYQHTNYNVSVVENGSIRYNGGVAGTSFKATSPAPEVNVIVSIKDGSIVIDDSGAPAISPEAPDTETTNH